MTKRTERTIMMRAEDTAPADAPTGTAPTEGAAAPTPTAEPTPPTRPRPHRRRGVSRPIDAAAPRALSFGERVLMLTHLESQLLRIAIERALCQVSDTREDLVARSRNGGAPSQMELLRIMESLREFLVWGEPPDDPPTIAAWRDEQRAGATSAPTVTPDGDGAE
jgi:hypothetical protein